MIPQAERRQLRGGLAAALLVPLLLVSCEEFDFNMDVEDDPTQASVEFRIHAPDHPDGATFEEGETSYTIDSVEVDFSRIEVENRQGANLPMAPPGQPVHFTASQEYSLIAQSEMPANSYHNFLMQLGSGENGDADGSGNGVFVIRIDGEFDGSAFTYRYQQPLNLELALSPPVNLRQQMETAKIFRITADPAQWLAPVSGNELLDPADEANEEVINDNIRYSISLDRDENNVVIHDAEAARQDSVISFTVELSDIAPHDISVAYRTRDQSAKAGEHFEAVEDTLHFEPGETEKQIDVELHDAEMNAPEVTFRMLLSEPSGVRLHNRDRQAFGTINNDDDDNGRGGGNGSGN